MQYILKTLSVICFLFDLESIKTTRHGKKSSYELDLSLPPFSPWRYEAETLYSVCRFPTYSLINSTHTTESVRVMYFGGKHFVRVCFKYE